MSIELIDNSKEVLYYLLPPISLPVEDYSLNENHRWRKWLFANRVVIENHLSKLVGHYVKKIYKTPSKRLRNHEYPCQIKAINVKKYHIQIITDYHFVITKPGFLKRIQVDCRPVFRFSFDDLCKILENYLLKDLVKIISDYNGKSYEIIKDELSTLDQWFL